MPIAEHKGRTYEVDECGHLKHFDKWDENWADYVRAIEGISELTNEHWKVINILQKCYMASGESPRLRVFREHSDDMLVTRVYEIFISGYKGGACKMAGVPRPAG